MDKDILHKYIIGEASPEEKEAVTRWVDSDKENMKEYLALRKLYNITIWQNEPAHFASERLSEGRKRWTLWAIGREVLKIAAIFAIAFSVVSTYNKAEPETVRQEAVMQTIYVPAGQRAELTLSDSTQPFRRRQPECHTGWRRLFQCDPQQKQTVHRQDGTIRYKGFRNGIQCPCL